MDLILFILKNTDDCLHNIDPNIHNLLLCSSTHRGPVGTVNMLAFGLTVCQCCQSFSHHLDGQRASGTTNKWTDKPFFREDGGTVLVFIKLFIRSTGCLSKTQLFSQLSIRAPTDNYFHYQLICWLFFK